MDAGLAFMQTAVPLSALRFGVTNVQLGAVGWVAQAVRLPVCFISGRLSEKIGRSTITVPAAFVLAIICIVLARSGSYVEIIIFYTLGMAAIGAFYPPLQALIGDVSRHGELTKNVGVFNIGWCVGGAFAALSAGILIGIRLSLAFYAAALCGLAAGLSIMLWQRGRAIRPQSSPIDINVVDNSSALLLIARMGHFTGFFAFAIIRILFPKLGVSLGWTKSEVAIVVAMLLVGQAVGILSANASPWWRGKVWPQLTAQAAMLVSAVGMAIVESPIIFALCFLVSGAALGIAYTAALYHGLSTGKNLGINTGIHESLVAAGNIFGCLIGGFAAQHISDRAPYALIAFLAVGCLLVSIALSHGIYQNNAKEPI